VTAAEPQAEAHACFPGLGHLIFITHGARSVSGCKPGQENPRLRLQRRTGEVICAVLDPSDTIPVLKAPGCADHSGRGLQIVDVLSDVRGGAP
jgi:hypothetical protein